MTPNKKRVLLIGWDGADWEHINPLLDQGLLPTLNELIEGGTIGNLATLQPVLSPMLWNSVATCKFADKHGIHGFVEPDPVHGGSRPFSSLSRKTKALWNILSQSGIRSNVINWWASHPAEKINGCVVSNLFNGVRLDPQKGWVVTPGTIHPAEREQELAQFKMLLSEVTEEHILPFIPGAAGVDQSKDPRLMAFAKTFTEMMTTHSVATAVMESEPWEFMAVYYTGIDHFSHGFMQYHPPQMPNTSDEDFEMYKDVIKGAYRFHDMMLERLLFLAGEETTVILCSDHGFQSGAFRPGGTPREPAGPAVWHRQYGVLVMKGEGIKQDERIYGASLIDIGPTILQLYGLPIGDDMDGRPLVEAFEEPPEVETLPSWDEVDGDHGMHCGNEEMAAGQSAELLQQFVALGYIDDQGDDQEKQFESADIEGKYNLARCLMWQDRNDEARPLLENILFRSPWENRFIIQLADCYLRSGYLQQAKALIDQTFDLESTTSNQAVILYAKVLLELSEIEQGTEYLVLASHRTPRFPALHVQIGDMFAKRGKWEEAETAYGKAIELHPDLALAYQGLSTVYLRQGKNGDAASAALDAVSLLHRLPVAHLNLGIAMARTNDLQRSIQAFQTAARFAPRQPRPQRWLATVYDQLGESAMADRHRQRALFLSAAGRKESQAKTGRANQRFELPQFETEKERVARLFKERPNPNDPVKKSGKTFVLVSGLPRSGTSLMMQMLVAGGMEAITDGKRTADEHNPKGYLEWEEIKRIAQAPELLDADEYDGQAIKVVSVLLKSMPREHDYKVIFMQRPIPQIVRSQARMIEKLGTEGAQLEEREIARGLTAYRRDALDWLKTAQHMEAIEIDYPSLIRSPEEWIQKITHFLGNDRLQQSDQMNSVIDRGLFRQRSEPDESSETSANSSSPD